MPWTKPWFDPIAALAARLSPRATSIPGVDALNEEGRARGLEVRFVVQPARPSQREPRLGYDERVTVHAEVPTRIDDWHDFFNALIWLTFPRSKRALHARQHRAFIASGRAKGRTREQDVLAMIDEGGVLTLAPNAQPLVFGHAIYEHLLRGEDQVWPRLVPLPFDDLRVFARDGSNAAATEVLDSVLAVRLEDPAWLPPRHAAIALRDLFRPGG